MDNVNLIVMGKTGTGKSTLINAILEDDLAPTGSGQAVTKETKVYFKNVLLSLGEERRENGLYCMTGKRLNLHDTVGLEIDDDITQNTLKEIKEIIRGAQNDEKDNDVTVVLFCINCRSHRFESFEVELIKNLSIDYEIPFIIVVTQCYTMEKSDLEMQIEKELPSVPIIRVLAKEYKTRVGVIPAYGIEEVLCRSILDYNRNKVKILEEKLNRLISCKSLKIQELKSKAKKCISTYSDKATKIGIVPVACIPIVHGICVKMLVDLNKIFEINSSKGFAADIFADAIVGVVVTPMMGVPLLSSVVASAYIETVGESYTSALIDAIERSSDKELINTNLMAKRIKEELTKRRKK